MKGLGIAKPSKRRVASKRLFWSASEDGLSALSSPDADRLLDWNNEHPTVVDASSPSFTDNRSNRAPDAIVSNNYLEFKFRQKFAEVFGAVSDGGVIRMLT